MTKKVKIKDLVGKGGSLSTLQRQYDNIMKENEGRFVKITFEFSDNEPTLTQYGYLYGCVYPNLQQFILETQGELYTINEIDSICKKTFFWSEEINEQDLRVDIIEERKSKNGKHALTCYIESIVISLETQGWRIPSPQEYRRSCVDEYRNQVIYRKI